MRNQCEQRLSQRNVEASGASVELTDTKYIYAQTEEGEVEAGKVFGSQMIKDLEAVQTLLCKQMKTWKKKKKTHDLSYFFRK